jgi:hypothetical protein
MRVLMILRYIVTWLRCYTNDWLGMDKNKSKRRHV